jgi:RND family efflux transporter MFP subunit
MNFRVLPVLVTLIMCALGGLSAWAVWSAYVASPWTRDGTMRVYVVSMAPEVAGKVTELRVADNQFVHRGDLLMVIDPTNYAIAVTLAEAAVAQAKADRDNKLIESQRRDKLTTLSTSVEQRESYAARALAAQASYQQMVANLAQARVNLERTRLVAPVTGWVTNLTAQLGDYAMVGQRDISLVNADSFWVDGYFEEGAIARIHENDRARIKLMGYKHPLLGHVQGVARAIEVANAQTDSYGLASVNPIFTWIRLAQRVPVRVAIDKVPPEVRLIAGMTATVEIEAGAPAVTAPENR